VTGELVLAVDVGTSAVKVAVVDATGRVCSNGRAQQQILGAPDGAREHDPELTWRATAQAITAALTGLGPARSLLAAIAVTGPRGTFCLIDPGGKPVTRFITWQDQRSAATVRELPRHCDAGRYSSLTGMEFSGFSVLPKLLWMRGHDASIFGGSVSISTPQGFVLRRLGASDDVTDPSVAAHFGLLDLRTRRWSTELCEAFVVESLMLPLIMSTGSIVGETSAAAARELGVPAGIPLVLPGSDGICSELGAGVTRPGQLYAYLGTAATIAGPVLATVGSGSHKGGVIRMPGYDQAHDRLLGLGGAGGSAVDWAVRLLGLRDAQALDELAARSAPGAGGVCFIPALAGAAAPVPEPMARAVFAGFSLGTGREHLARAVLEGVAVELRWMLGELLSWGVQPAEVRLTGGGAGSDTWAQVIADVLGLRIVRSSHPEPGLQGAASYALAAVTGQAVAAVAAHWSAAGRVIVTEPAPGLGELYGRLAETYRLLRHGFAQHDLDQVLFENAQQFSADADP
jgi:xylulokinase